LKTPGESLSKNHAARGIPLILGADQIVSMLPFANHSD
jgi:hypothetical protein